MTTKTKNNVKITGKPEHPTIMFAHGYGCDQSMWRFVVPSFTDGFQVITFDHVGSGNSDQSAYDFEKYDSLDGYAGDVIEILEENGLDQVIFIGHSVSAMIGALVAIKRPELIKKLVMIGPSPCYINKEDYYGGFEEKDIEEMISTLEDNYLGWSSYITPVIIGRPDKPEFSEELNNSFCSIRPDIAKHFAKVTFTSDNRNDLSKIKVPTLIIQTEPDVIAPEKVGEYVYHQISGSVFTKIQTAGHCPHLTAPELTIEEIKKFLNYGG
ncbi:alpha/beta fold hydrolase [Arthrospiribacter ruber]|uniref:Alpha/beta hydrolase n=1 Tax=Arthrospiribacter ruber TaxID=2487934 RepID=A0A951IYW0_9BACT|nr:alpha/beta hydrolase [Arthrospiribacter ruber]MBW3468422.1 alpha/beta hydrolase [Arthrospiribacter ruber]